LVGSQVGALLHKATVEDASKGAPPSHSRSSLQDATIELEERQISATHPLSRSFRIGQES